MSKKIKNLIKYGGLYPENEFTRLIQRQKFLNRQVAQQNKLIHGPPRPPKWTEKASSPITREDGLYVDVSCRGVMYLGFALVEGSMISYLSTTSMFRGTDSAEREAVELAKRIIIGVTVYCDHGRICTATNAVYVKRHRNPAHTAARHRKGFVERQDLDLFLEGR